MVGPTTAARRLGSWIDHVWQDLRHGARVFARNPALTAIAVISIAFGTGANVAIFSVADALLLRPLPVARPSEMLTVGSKIQHGLFYQTSASYRDYLDIRERVRSFDGLVAGYFEMASIAPRADAPPRMRVATFVSDNYFQVLGVEPTLGRAFGPDDVATAGEGTVVVLSHGLWRSEFGGDSAVIGRTVRISGIEFTIAGVAPESFTGLHPYIRDSFFVPVSMLPRVVDLVRPDVLEAREARIMTLKGRLAPGATVSSARAELQTIARDLERAWPKTNDKLALIAQTELEFKIEQRPYDAAAVAVLGVLSIAVLCVACANVAGLLTSRAPVRAREMALRLAIGASRARLIRQLLTESLTLAVAGSAGGILVGQLLIRLLRQIQYPTDIIVHPVFELNERTLLFSLGVAMASALLVGFGPAITTTRVDLATSIKSTDRSGASRRRVTARAALVAAQVALSLVLLTVTLFSIQVFRRILDTGPGFRTSGVAMATISPGQAKYSDVEAARFFTQLLEEARALPGARSASLTSAMPLFSLPMQFSAVLPEGQEVADGQTVPPAWANRIDDRYFETMAIQLLAGRVFSLSDHADALPVAIVNEKLARHYWGDGSPIGQRVQLLDAGRKLVEIVGVVRTSTYGLPGELPQNAIYFPYRQQPRGQMVLLVQTAGEPAASLETMRDLVRRIDRDVPMFDVQTIETFYAARVKDTGSILVELVTGMGLMGMTLTTVGLYGLVSYAVSRRTREIGIRIAIGATAGRIVRMVLREGMTPAWFGVIAGLGLSVMTTRLMERMVPFGQRVGSETYYLVVPLLVVVALAAAFVPARRAARVNPTVALRCE
jgi:putative ABC transport system permease protein